MKIGMIAPPWFPIPPTGYGGIELVVSLLTEELVARGHDVTLFAPPTSRTSARLVSGFDELAPVGAIADIYNRAKKFPILHALTAMKMGAEFDIIHDHSGDVAAALGAMLGGKPPIVHTLHGQWGPPDSFARAFWAHLHNQINLVAISERQRADNDSVRYHSLVYNGIDLDAYPFQSNKDDYLVYIGRANHEKLPTRAIEIAREAGMPLQMIAKRSEEHEQKYWNDNVVPLLGDDITVHQDVTHEKKCELLANAKAMIFPIQWAEPFGLVMVEAMACGTPVVTTFAGAAPELVADGETGFLRDDDADLVAAIGMVDNISPEMCRKHVEERFSFQRMTDDYLATYSQLV